MLCLTKIHRHATRLTSVLPDQGGSVTLPPIDDPRRHLKLALRYAWIFTGLLSFEFCAYHLMLVSTLSLKRLLHGIPYVFILYGGNLAIFAFLTVQLNKRKKWAANGLMIYGLIYGIVVTISMLINLMQLFIDLFLLINTCMIPLLLWNLWHARNDINADRPLTERGFEPILNPPKPADQFIAQTATIPIPNLGSWLTSAISTLPKKNRRHQAR
jgi:hypothetical protein